MYFLHYTVMNEYDIGSPESPKMVQELHGATLKATDENYSEQMAFAKANSYNGEVTVEEVENERTAAPCNISAGEYVTIDEVLYLATENIPSGEPVIAGQNATITTIEEQLCEMKGE